MVGTLRLRRAIKARGNSCRSVAQMFYLDQGPVRSQAKIRDAKVKPGRASPHMCLGHVSISGKRKGPHRLRTSLSSALGPAFSGKLPGSAPQHVSWE